MYVCGIIYSVLRHNSCDVHTFFKLKKTDIASPQNAQINLKKYKRINLHNENITKLGKKTEKNGARLKILSCNFVKTVLPTQQIKKGLNAVIKTNMI